MAVTSVKHDFTASGFKTKALAMNFAANDTSGTVYVNFNRVVAFADGLIGTAAGGTADAHPRLLLADSSYAGTNTGTAAGVSGSTLTFTRAGAGTSLASNHSIVLFGW